MGDRRLCNADDYQDSTVKHQCLKQGGVKHRHSAKAKLGNLAIPYQR